jgi:hypothetical protein
MTHQNYFHPVVNSDKGSISSSISLWLCWPGLSSEYSNRIDLLFEFAMGIKFPLAFNVIYQRTNEEVLIGGPFVQVQPFGTGGKWSAERGPLLVTLSAVLETDIIADLRQKERERLVSSPCTPRKRSIQPRGTREEVIIID